MTELTDLVSVMKSSIDADVTDVYWYDQDYVNKTSNRVEGYIDVGAFAPATVGGATMYRGHGVVKFDIFGEQDHIAPTADAIAYVNDRSSEVFKKTGKGLTQLVSGNVYRVDWQRALFSKVITQGGYTSRTVSLMFVAHVNAQ